MIKYSNTSPFQDLMGFVPQPPAVSILVPVHPVFSSGAEFGHRVKIALENARRQLLRNYPGEITLDVMGRLEKLRLEVKYDTHHKGVAFFASPHKGKLYYLDIPVEERLVIGDTFAIRDLVADSKELREYLILVLSDRECRFYLAGEGKLELLKTSAPAEVYAYVNEKPERVANFSDAAERKEIVMDKFLHHMDQEISVILAEHPLPLFVLGPERILGHFKVHSRHLAQITAYVQGNYLEAGEEALRECVQPCLEIWRQNKQRTVMSHLQTAAGQKRLSVGILDAWAAAWHNNGHVLVVEKGYRFAARRGDTADRIFREDFPEENPFCMQDAVDALIAQVIREGGDVEFVDDGILNEYDHLALIRYY